MAATAESIATPVRGVPPEHVVALWPRVAPILERVVLPETGYALDHVLTELQLSRWLLWIIGDFDGAVITSVQARPLERVLWVQYMVGEGMADWLDDWIAVQDEYARDMGCTAVEFQSSRKAWARIRDKYPEHESEYAIWRKRLE